MQRSTNRPIFKANPSINCILAGREWRQIFHPRWGYDFETCLFDSPFSPSDPRSQSQVTTIEEKQKKTDLSRFKMNDNEGLEMQETKL
jgi:hypothetical protein